MPTQKERLQQQLASIEKKEAEQREKVILNWKHELTKPRQITLVKGRVVDVVFDENYKLGSTSPDKVVELLQDKTTTLVRFDFNGTLYDVQKGDIRKFSDPEDELESRDKGRPSIVLCNKDGFNVCSFCFYPTDDTIMVFDTSEVHAW